MNVETNPSSLKDLVHISRYYGRKKDYVLAGGGNTSFKDKEKLWIKASGVSLETINETGFVCLSRNKLKKISEKKYSSDILLREAEVKKDLNAAIIGGDGQRPSVETSLHEIIDYPYVVHTHPTLLNALLCSKNSKDISLELFGNDVLYIEYTDPGYILFKKVEEELGNFRKKTGEDPQVILLENHGVFVGAKSIDEIKSKYRDIENKIEAKISQKIPETKSSLNKVEFESISKGLGPNNENVHIEGMTSWIIEHFTRDREMFSKMSIPFTPDIIVYCKSKYLFFEENEFGDPVKVKNTIDEFTSREGYLPKVIASQGKGLFIFEESDQAAKTVASVFQDFMKISFYSENFGGPRPMTPEQIKFIDNWEVENYRRKVSKSILKE